MNMNKPRIIEGSVIFNVLRCNNVEAYKSVNLASTILEGSIQDKPILVIMRWSPLFVEDTSGEVIEQ